MQTWKTPITYERKNLPNFNKSLSLISTLIHFKGSRIFASHPDLESKRKTQTNGKIEIKANFAFNRQQFHKVWGTSMWEEAIGKHLTGIEYRMLHMYLGV